MLQRIYGTAFATQGELDAYLVFLEEAARRDHRKLGPGTGICSRSRKTPAAASSSGIPRARSSAASSRTSSARVCASAATSPSLRRTSRTRNSTKSPAISRTSRHSMFGPIEVEGQRFRLKPMNCPGHILIYRSEGRSYRDLPLRYSEFGTVYRFERSGTLHGLTRVRGFTQDDAHLFCMPEQLQGEFEQTARRSDSPNGSVWLRRFRVLSLDA